MDSGSLLSGGDSRRQSDDVSLDVPVGGSSLLKKKKTSVSARSALGASTKSSYGGTTSSDEYESADLESRGGDGKFTSGGAVADPTRRKRRIIVSIGVALIVALTIVVVILATKKSKDDSSDSGGAASERLPRNFLPNSYVLDLTIDLATSTFAGEVTINTTAIAATDTVVLNSLGLSIDKVKGTGASGALTPTSVYVNDTAEEVEMQFPATFAVNESVLITVAFHGTLSTSMNGLYRSTYTDPSNITHVIAATQFEPTDARRAFPSFDEPAYKATFDITLTYPVGYFALSNMPVLSTAPVNGTSQVTTRFLPTKPMSSYLVAFVVCDFASINTTFTVNTLPTPTQVSMGVYAEPSLIGSAQEALQAGANVTAYFGQLLNSPYPLPKEDMIAIPDFAAGAMENWGLVTYRRTALLVDSATGSSSDLQRVVVVVAHELAHQWFGDLVTMDWWSDLWLNEGFATYFEFVGVISARPSWRYGEQFVTSAQQPALQVDALNSSRAIVAPVSTPNEINAMFDTVTYQKGGSILRMINGLIGNDNFILGLKQYLAKYAYGNANTQNLWDELQKVVGTSYNITDVFDPWVRQPGYPVLIVNATSDSTLTTWTIRQTRYFFDPTAPPSTATWTVPIQYAYQEVNGSPQTANMLLSGTSSASFSTATVSWLKLNMGQTGFYRVLYPEDHWLRLAAVLQQPSFTAISLVDRSALLDDAFNLAFSAHLSWQTALNFSQYLVVETEYVPWLTAWNQLSTISSFIQQADAAAFNRFGYTLASGTLATAIASLNKTTDHTTNLLIGLGLAVSARFNASDARIRALALFQQLRAGTPLWAQISGTVLQYAVVAGTSDDWQFVYSLFAASTVAADRERYLSALAASTDMSLVTQLLNMCLNGTIPAQDSSTALIYVARNSAALQTLVKFVLANIVGLLSRASGLNSFGRVLSTMVSQLVDPDQLQQVTTALMAQQQIGPGGVYNAALNTGIAAAQARGSFILTQYRSISSWLQMYYGDGSVVAASSSVAPPVVDSSSSSSSDASTAGDSSDSSSSSSDASTADQSSSSSSSSDASTADQSSSSSTGSSTSEPSSSAPSTALPSSSAQ